MHDLDRGQHSNELIWWIVGALLLAALIYYGARVADAAIFPQLWAV